MIAFVDTSVVLRFVLEGAISLHQAFAATGTACSDLLWIESMQVTQRLRLDGGLDDEGMRQAAAGPFPTVIGTLDALHPPALAGLPTIIPENLCARALGFSTPLADAGSTVAPH